jgi:SAM-dependent methyltransferase
MNGRGRDVQTPRYVVRKRTVRDVVQALPPGKFLEIGCGRGDMLPMLSAAGHTGLAVEISESVFPEAVATAELLPDINVVQSLAELANDSFQYLFAFEVLEHIEDDARHLQEWLRHLRPGGLVVITVPAHSKLWTSADDAVGHYRRYERETLIRLLEDSKLEVVEIRAFGYPLVLLTRPLRHLQHRARRDTGLSTEQRTLESSTDSTLAVPRSLRAALRVAVRIVSLGFYYLGLPLRRTDHGDGYLVVAKRKTY